MKQHTDFTVGVGSLEFERLKSYQNDLINKHICRIFDDYYNYSKEHRGNIFLDAYHGNSLNEYEAILISSYAGFVAGTLNDQLRRNKDQLSKEYAEYEYLLNKSLSKLPSENNSSVRVMFNFQGTKSKLFNWYEKRIGETIQFPNFLSSSRKRWESRAYLEVKTNSNSAGKYIAPLTDKKESEEEVLFMSNSVFRIRNVDKKTSIIHLFEEPFGTKGKYLLSN